MNMYFCCPVCGGLLNADGVTARCPDGHSFDRARQGYYNFLVGRSGGQHGDDSLMVRQRTAFLEKGYYSPLRDLVSRAALCVPAGSVILDSGCGEGWYGEGVYNALQAACKTSALIGIDISRDAVKSAARRGCYKELSVGSVSRLPLSDKSCGGVLNIFSPLALEEYSRVLCRGGLLIRALPLKEHLYELKAAVYDKPYYNSKPDYPLEGFTLKSCDEIHASLCVSPTKDIMSLFEMTPYCYKTSPADKAKLKALDVLNVSFAVAVAVYEKQ